MCGPAVAVPAWVAYASVATAVASTAMTAYGMYQQGQQQKAQAEYQSAVARNNAMRAEYMAQDAQQRGVIAEQQQRLRGRLLLGSMRASQASSGVDINEGSALDLQVSQAGANELDALNVRNNAEREAQNYRLQAADYTGQAGLYQYAGNNAASNGMWGAAGSLLGGVGSVAGKWYAFDKAGAFNSTPSGGSSGGGSSGGGSQQGNFDFETPAYA